MRKIHISDSNAKNTFVYFAPIKPPKNPLKAFGKERVFINDKNINLGYRKIR